MLHEIRRLLALWQQVSAAGSTQLDTAVSACLDILECLWTTVPDSWSYQAWAFRSMLSPIACQASDIGVRLPPQLYACNRCSTRCRRVRMRFSLWMRRTSCFWTKRCRVDPLIYSKSSPETPLFLLHNHAFKHCVTQCCRTGHSKIKSRCGKVRVAIGAFSRMRARVRCPCAQPQVSARRQRRPRLETRH